MNHVHFVKAVHFVKVVRFVGIARFVLPALACGLLEACATAAPAPSTAAARAKAIDTIYQRDLSARLVPMLQEVLRFPTRAEDKEGHAAQKAWLFKTAAASGFVARDAGKVTEIELPAADGAPVLGLIVHGDVQPVDAEGWTHPPFAGEVERGVVYGRGAADDKGPLIQALLAMTALRDSGLPRTHTVRLLVGSDEESGSTDLKEYVKSHAAPDVTLVLDSDFPVTVGEKAWHALAVSGLRAERGSPLDYSIESLEAGLAPSIVPDKARLVLRWKAGAPRWTALIAKLRAKPLPQGTSATFAEEGPLLTIAVKGKAAHSGANIEGGRNATVALAILADGELPASGWADLLGFAKLAGQGIYGEAFGLPAPDPLWGGMSVNVATIGAVGDPWGNPKEPGALELLINVRRSPALGAPQLQEKLEAKAKEFNARTGAALHIGGFHKDEPLVIDPNAKLVRRLLAAVERGTGKPARGVTSGGGTYAKHVPNSIAFGMWFREAGPYPGHDVDEKIGVEWLQLGTKVLIEALADLACGARMERPLEP